jgi:arginyl-tRNA--protein-N-Asp/Glu arginylyltransferase
MKNYKAKFNGYSPNGLIRKVSEGDIICDAAGSGVHVFIPFTDTRFFEPVKTRKFEIEVSEEQMSLFNTYVVQHDDRWTIREITENEYMRALKASPDVAIEVIETLRDTLYLEKVVTAFQIIKEREGGKLSTVKGLKDYTDKCAATIRGLKNAKDIVYAWWDVSC